KIVSITKMATLMDKTVEFEVALDDSSAAVPSSWNNSLVIHIHNGREYSLDILYKALRKSWKPTGDFHLSYIGSHTYLVKFDYICDLNYVLRFTPWSINDDLIVVEKAEQDKAVSDYLFNKTTFSVQIHGLPP
ncbi:hypothetical protein MKX01_008794, partial [Papaver californicum]